MSSAHPSCDFDLYTVEYVFEHVFLTRGGAQAAAACGSRWKYDAAEVHGFAALLAGSSSTRFAALKTCE